MGDEWDEILDRGLASYSARNRWLGWRSGLLGGFGAPRAPERDVGLAMGCGWLGFGFSGVVGLEDAEGHGGSGAGSGSLGRPLFFLLLGRRGCRGCVDGAAGEETERARKPRYEEDSIGAIGYG